MEAQIRGLNWRPKVATFGKPLEGGAPEDEGFGGGAQPARLRGSQLTTGPLVRKDY